MYKKKFDQVPLWQFDIFSNDDTIKHFVSGREGGVSAGEKGGLNLSYSADDMAKNVLQNRKLVADAMGVDLANLIFPQQTHGNKVVNIKNAVNANKDSLACTDALITGTLGVCIAVMAADCVPVLIYDPVNRAVGAVHAGWRGTVNKILTHAVEAMSKEFGSDPEAINIGIGPSISPQVYEVGDEVINAVHDAYEKEANQLLLPSQSAGKARFNLWEANRLQLKKLGVREKNLEIAKICTYTNRDQFFSARASVDSGRFAAGILLVAS